MCFSAEASFISSAVLTAGGVATLKHVDEGRQLPYAVFPLIFAFHQFIEGCLWLSQTSAYPDWFVSLLAHGFPIIAYCVWPTLVPYAIYRMETDPLRKLLLSACLLVGVCVSVFFFYYITTGPLTAKFINESIHYDFYFSFWILSQWLYGFSIIMAALFSSHKFVNVFGVGLVISYNIAKIFYTATYPSVFCFLAAVLSLIIFAQVRFTSRSRSECSAPSTI